MKNYLVLLFLGCSMYAWADSPPSWEPYIVYSENNEYLALIDYADQDSLKYPWERNWEVGIFDKSKQLVWKRDFHPSGYREGKLTNDGKYFVILSFWYYKKAFVIEAYNQIPEKDIFIEGKEFQIPEEFLTQTASHKLWLKDSYLTNEKITIITNDDSIWELNFNERKLKLVQNHSLFLIKIFGGTCLFLLILLAYIFFFNKRLKFKKKARKFS